MEALVMILIVGLAGAGIVLHALRKRKQGGCSSCSCSGSCSDAGKGESWK